MCIAEAKGRCLMLWILSLLLVTRNKCKKMGLENTSYTNEAKLSSLLPEDDTFGYVILHTQKSIKKGFSYPHTNLVSNTLICVIL